MKKSKITIIHIFIIVVGIIFISLGAFHKNLWFDETYSVALVEHSFSDIWRIGGNDVHPILYYMLLKVVNIFFGKNIIVYRIFSIIGVAILSILGITHIRKDFGEKVGAYFSFLALFLPVMAVYASEIRMYSWAILFVTLAAIYAYRLTKQNKLLNWFLFGLFGLFSIYTHYYGVMAIVIISAGLFIYFLKRVEIRKKCIKNLIILCIIQVVLYIPWLQLFFTQLSNVSQGFWISLSFPGTIFEIMDFQCLGNVDERIAIITSFSLFIISFYVMNQLKKKSANASVLDKEIDPGKCAIVIYLVVILLAAILSLKTAILYPRYIFVISGLLIFCWSYYLAKLESKKISITLCTLIVASSIYSNILFIVTNYNKNNIQPIEYINNNIQQGDVIIFKNSEVGTGSVIDVNIDGNKTYFYNEKDWIVEKAYEAYAPDMEIIDSLDELDDVKGRIWILDSNNYNFYNQLSEKYFVEIIEKNTIKTQYKDYEYNFVLISK